MLIEPKGVNDDIKAIFLIEECLYTPKSLYITPIVHPIYFSYHQMIKHTKSFF